MIVGSERRVKDEVLKDEVLTQSRMMQENQRVMQEQQWAFQKEMKQGLGLILDCGKANSDNSQERLNPTENYLTTQSNASLFLQHVQTITICKVKEKVHH